jgi:hypothetical protein
MSVPGRREPTRTLKTRAAVAVSPFPVPRCLPGNTSEEAAYSTPNIIWKHLSMNEEGRWGGITSAVEFTHVTEKSVSTVPPEQRGGATGGSARKQKRPRDPWIHVGVVGQCQFGEQSMYSPVEAARVPRRPMNGSSMDHPARNALGIPITEIMTCCGLVGI